MAVYNQNLFMNEIHGAQACYFRLFREVVSDDEVRLIKELASPKVVYFEVKKLS